MAVKNKGTRYYSRVIAETPTDVKKSDFEFDVLRADDQFYIIDNSKIFGKTPLYIALIIFFVGLLIPFSNGPLSDKIIVMTIFL